MRYEYGLIPFVLCILFFVLYRKGYLVFQNKRASLFVGRKRGKEAIFASCTGKISRYLYFKDENVKFQLDLELDNGEITFELYDKKNLILKLDKEHLIAEASVEPNKAYRFVIRFKAASGKYNLEY